MPFKQAFKMGLTWAPRQSEDPRDHWSKYPSERYMEIGCRGDV